MLKLLGFHCWTTVTFQLHFVGHKIITVTLRAGRNQLMRSASNVRPTNILLYKNSRQPVPQNRPTNILLYKNSRQPVPQNRLHSLHFCLKENWIRSMKCQYIFLYILAVLCISSSYHIGHRVIMQTAKTCISVCPSLLVTFHRVTFGHFPSLKHFHSKWVKCKAKYHFADNKSFKNFIKAWKFRLGQTGSVKTGRNQLMRSAKM